jgi:hypothetical protein
MFKDFLLNSIIQEMKIIRRLATKIESGQGDYRPKESIRSFNELLQYLSVAGTNPIRYWYRKDTSVDFRTFVTEIATQAKATVTTETFVKAMDAQIELITKLFDQITEEDLLNKEVDYPWGDKAKLGEAIINTSIKWLTAYKMQLFLKLKLASDIELKTPDLWRKTELETV